MESTPYIRLNGMISFIHTKAEENYSYYERNYDFRYWALEAWGFLG